MKIAILGLVVSSVFLSTTSATGEPHICEPEGAEVETAAEHATRVCDAVSVATGILEQCKLPRVPDGLQMRVVDTLDPDCMAMYDCDKKEITILSPPEMNARRSPGAFSHLEIESYFESVVVHEVTHAAFANLPCPFDSCVVAQEYAAYAVQVMSLSEAERAQFVERSDIQKRISRDELSEIILFMAPDLFAQKVWAHLQQQDDQCAFLLGVVSGAVLLDRGRF